MTPPTPKSKSIIIAEESMEILELIAGKQLDDLNLSLSGAVNLVAQLAWIVARDPLRITPGELMYCCDICNGGAPLTEFKAPDAVSIRQALEGMKHSLQDGTAEPGLLEKWAIDDKRLISRLELMEEPQLFALAMATRQFWSNKPLPGVTPPSDCESYEEWASQWVEPDL